ncbi:MAG: ATP-dependent DNA helicase RecG [Anaerolineae bacterium]|nr:ATP-dependent DNA helicase RecG [Anaerolineae bacterium]
MARPVETLSKMLALEARDFDYRDRAVAGGLAGYVDTWRRQASEAFGDGAEAWIALVAGRLERYSELDQAGRRALIDELLPMLQQGHIEGTQPAQAVPQSSARPATGSLHDASSASPAVPALGSPPAPGITQPPMRRPPSPAQEGRAAATAARDGRGLDAPVAVLPGIGAKRSGLLQKLGVHTLRDFIHTFPRRYEDYSLLKTIDRLEYGERVSVLATVWEAGLRKTHHGRELFRAILSDETGTMEVTWFGKRRLEERLRPGMHLLISGKVDEYLGRLTMNSPDWEIVGRTDVANARIQPVYPLSEGLTQLWMRAAMRRALAAWASRIPDALPEALRADHELLPLSRALWGVHLPDSHEHLTAARRRLAFEEVLYLQLGLLRQKRQWKSQPGRRIATSPERTDALGAAFPFPLTAAQQRAVKEMLNDLASGDPMNRLLQGDVGSGKTAVAAFLMAVVADADCQVAMMAPTEILAEQHFKSLSKLFAGFPEPRPALGLLTGSTAGADREQVYAGLADGSLRVVVGTHALIQEAVAFRDLALVVIDEQHRFGVEQRATLREKGYNPHLLVMTATPIPRSLELTFWGHVDVSVLDEMPPGRQQVKTRVLTPRERGRAYAYIQGQVELGKQAFIIYPLVESSDTVDARAATDEYERLQKEVFPHCRLGLLHGRMRSADKEHVMTGFAGGELDILVATSVVEVGIDVPNATVMLIDGADRFGLAQLHQFRGRVGRGADQAYCLLLAGDTSAQAAERLAAVESTHDGFVLAEKDLAMRGPGEFLGTQQSGFPILPMAEFTDVRMLRDVRGVASALLEEDPDLTLPEHRFLRERVAALWESAGDLS